MKGNIRQSENTGRSGGKWAILAVAAGILAVPVIAFAAPVDLTPPKNSIGYSDDQGYLRMVQRFGTVKFSDGFELPLRFDFWTGRIGEESLYGWDGWNCGIFESRVEFFGEDRFLKATLLCAKVLFLEQTEKNRNEYRSPDGAWIGRISGDTVSISREDGWDLQFTGGLVSGLRTDTGLMIKWNRDPDGRLLTIGQSGSDKPVLKVNWEESGTEGAGKSSAVASLTVGGDKVVDFDYGENGTLETVAWAGTPWKLKLVQDSESLRVTDRRARIREFRWNDDTGRILSDGINDYRILANPKDPSVGRRIVLTNGKGETISRQIDLGEATARYVNERGQKIVTYRIKEPGPKNGKISRIELSAKEGPLLLMENRYDLVGRVKSRQWRGSPIRYRDYQGGRIENALTPNSSVTYEIDRIENPAEAKLEEIEYRYDDKGRHMETLVGGNSILKIEYDDDSEGEIVRIAVKDRFEKVVTALEDGSRIQSLTIAGISEKGPFPWVNSSDPTLTPGLVIRRRFDSDEKLVSRRLIDGRTQTIEYDDRGRRKSEFTMAPDGKTRIADRIYLYDPARPNTALRVDEDLFTGKRIFTELNRDADGRLKHDRLSEDLVKLNWKTDERL